ncbi:histidinol dehydrogenase [Parapedobacter defluvii]|uniref:Histidinol dehydrogenase n=1 Tax=Parapedobacter defluvii TaxID=2045106 RepID=A0ABQ1MPL1_9SPHI|nr:histidinol dehydrogenase [Parapedobacter defluvii]GGC42267.1 histidinol dehydrogenase [Parapedobacter defluvii]
MLQTYRYSTLQETDFERLLARNTDPSRGIEQLVMEIIGDVKTNGDAALKKYAEKFDGVQLTRLYLEANEIASLASTIGREQQRALEIAFANIYRFHETQLRKERSIETMPGVKCWREPRPIEKVGLYIPGGSAVLPSTLLMLGVPARIAGCKEIVVCSPPQADGKINGYIAYCLQLLKIDRIYLVGGAQAVAAMAYGTESVPRVDKIFGPGNQYVTKAKSLLQGLTNVSIDMPAGPSEVLVIADDSANPEYVAADLLAQAEHGADSQAILVSTNEQLIDKVQVTLKTQLALLPRAAVAEKALANSYAILCANLEEAIAFSNQYAPEHLIIETDNWVPLLRKVSNAGSVFVGHLTPESVGDYASGTNHTLPTSGYARSYSGVSVDAFVKKITFQHLTAEGLRNIGPTVEILAELEGLQAHKNAVSVRLH